MNRFLRARRPFSYANVVASVALFVALGGSSYAAVQITGADIRNHSVTAAEIKPGSLLASDFKPGQLKAATDGATTWTYHQDLGILDINDLPAIPGLGYATLVCSLDGDGSSFLYIHNTSAAKVESVADFNSTGASPQDLLFKQSIDAGSAGGFRIPAGLSRLTLQMFPAAVSDPGPVATITATYIGAPRSCDLTAQATYADPSHGTPVN